MSSLDPHAINALRELNPGDDSFLRDLIQIFLEDAPLRLAEIEESLARGDGRRLMIAAHSLKGSSANFGAEQLRTRCEEIERCGRLGVLDPVPAQLPALRQEYARVEAELQSLVPS
jgi:HPt (histidine-containing phosphotransfer) domain-containing protein